MSFRFVEAKTRKEQGQWDFVNGSRMVENGGATLDGFIKVLLLAQDPNQSSAAPDPESVTVTDVLGESGKFFGEYGQSPTSGGTGTGYFPGPGARVELPAITAAAPTPTNPNYITNLNMAAALNLGEPSALTGNYRIRGLLIYHEDGDATSDDDAPNCFCIDFLDGGNLYTPGQEWNGNGQPMSVTWSGLYGTVQDI